MEKLSNKKNKVVLFDIDYTLFDVAYFDTHFHTYLSQLLSIKLLKIHTISLNIILNLVEQESYLDVDKYISQLLKELGAKEYIKEVESFLFGALFFKEGFYKEVSESLEELSKIAKIGIFSQGDSKLQGAKIDQSGFAHLIDKNSTYIIKPKKIDILPQIRVNHTNDVLFLVDDKPSVILEAKKQIPELYTIWIKRGKYLDEALELDNFSPDSTISSICEVIDIVKN